ncbi:hypothetical protein EVAR_34038_1 [Eumeta japonica]|uniref:Uncharacterized protein n=1 Tax=Eumeta variegata TaxID=151549 RepID=A0A4C1VUW0_EUMVA|nr:hypothetical protein EVAR_34038_1 [Eumeta japonica]
MVSFSTVNHETTSGPTHPLDSSPRRALNSDTATAHNSDFYEAGAYARIKIEYRLAALRPRSDESSAEVATILLRKCE